MSPAGITVADAAGDSFSCQEAVAAASGTPAGSGALVGSPPRWWGQGAEWGGAAAAKVALGEAELEPITLAEHFPDRWTRLVRNAPLADVQPFGTRPLSNPAPPTKFGLP